MASTMLPTNARSCDPARREARRLVAAPDDQVGGLLDLLDLVAVDHLLVAGEVDHARPQRRGASGRSRTARRCPGRRRPAGPSPPPGVSVGVPVGPIRMTGSPGFSRAHRSDEPPISRTIVESSPLSRSTDAPVSARPSIASTVSPDRVGQGLVVLQPVELARLERPRRHRRPHDHLDDVRRQPDHLVHHGPQLVVQACDQLLGGRAEVGATRARTRETTG